MMESSDYYEVLNVSRSSTNEEIRKAYRKMALKWHPDKNLSQRELAEKNFKRISEAYEVLSDPQKKQVYDRFGKEGLEGGMGQGGSSHEPFNFPGMSGSFFGNIFNQFGGFSGFSFRDPNDVFREFFESDPFDAFFNADVGNPHASGHHEAPNPNHQQSGPGNLMFSNPFDLFGGLGGSDGFFGGSSMTMQMNSFGSGGPNVKSVSTSVKTVDGKRVETKRVVQNGVETVTVTENGSVVSKTVNGQPQLTN